MEFLKKVENVLKNMIKFIVKIIKYLYNKFYDNPNLFYILIVLIFMIHTCNVRNEYKKEINKRDDTISILNSELEKKVDVNGDTTYMKRIINENLKDLLKREDIYNLTENQKVLFNELSQVKRNNNVISRNVAEMYVLVNNLPKNNEPIVINDSTFVFKDTSDEHFKYNIEVSNVKSTVFSTPTLKVNDIFLPNRQIISFDYGERKEGHPITLSIRNTNPYFGINNIDGYIIPEINKENLKPSLINKYFYNRIHFGLGVGLNYNPLQNNFSLTPNVGVHYSLYQLKRK